MKSIVKKVLVLPIFFNGNIDIGIGNTFWLEYYYWY